jgi:hypothetical protein
MDCRKKSNRCWCIKSTKKLLEKNEDIQLHRVPDQLAAHFDIKIQDILRDVRVENNIHNRTKIFNIYYANFMDMTSKIMHKLFENKKTQRILTEFLWVYW